MISTSFWCPNAISDSRWGHVNASHDREHLDDSNIPIAFCQVIQMQVEHDKQEACEIHQSESKKCIGIIADQASGCDQYIYICRT